MSKREISFEEAKEYCSQNGFSMVPDGMLRKLCMKNSGPLIVTGKYIDTIRMANPETDASMILGRLHGDAFENLGDMASATIFFETEEELEQYLKWTQKVSEGVSWKDTDLDLAVTLKKQFDEMAKQKAETNAEKVLVEITCRDYPGLKLGCYVQDEDYIEDDEDYFEDDDD
jgi:hypothetical protein